MFLTPSNNLLSGYRQDADHIDTVCDSSVLPFTIVLPDLLLAEDKEYIFCNIGANAVTIKPIGGQLFSDGSSTYTLDAYQAATFVSDLKKCWIMSSGNADLLYQPLDADLTAIAALTGTSGLLKKTAANTWALDTSTYLTANQSITLSGAVTGSGTTAITTDFQTSTAGGFLGHSGTTSSALAMITSATQYHVPIIGASSALAFGYLTSSSFGTNILAVANGGTNLASYTVGDILYASGTTALSKLSDVATGSVLLSGGTSTAPSWGKASLTTCVSGILPVANGGTGNSSWTPWALICAESGPTKELTQVSVGTAGYVLVSQGGSNIPSWTNLATVYAPLTHGCSAGYFPYATSTTAWRNSPMYYNGTNIGIGTTSPSYLLTMEASGGGYYSASDHQWHNGSSRSIKKNIALNKINVLKILDELKIVQYNYKTEINTDMKHVGFIAEDTHPLLSGKDQNGQSVADCIGFLLAVVKIQQRQIKKLSKQRVLA
jgi:hypothetical protein